MGNDRQYCNRVPYSQEYESVTRIMPPDQQGGSAAMLAAMSGKALPGGMGR